MYALKSASVGTKSADDSAMERVNRYTRRTFGSEDVFLFSVRACDDQIDRDFERFTVPALHQLAQLFPGKPVIFDHAWSAQLQTARIYDAEVVADGSANYLRLDCYMLRSATTAATTEAIDAGILSEVSVGVCIAKRACSVCGADYATCGHMRGETYEGEQCIVLLDDAVDAYEVSFVAVPAQPMAGVTKAHKPIPMTSKEFDAAKRRLEIEKHRF